MEKKDFIFMVVVVVMASAALVILGNILQRLT